MGKDQKKLVDELVEMNAEGLKSALPSTLEEIHKHGIGKTLEDIPDLLPRIVGRLVDIDSAEFASEAPEVFERFMNLLWEGASIVVDRSDGLRPALEKAGEMNINLEASDSPFKSYFRISSGKLSGGWGLLHFKYQDFKLWGLTNDLMKLLSGSDFRQMIWTKLNFEGHPMFMPKVAMIMTLIIPRALGQSSNRC